jgi:hypothetical protein
MLLSIEKVDKEDNREYAPSCRKGFLPAILEEFTLDPPRPRGKQADDIETYRRRLFETLDRLSC